MSENVCWYGNLGTGRYLSPGEGVGVEFLRLQVVKDAIPRILMVEVGGGREGGKVLWTKSCLDHKTRCSKSVALFHLFNSIFFLKRLSL